jgi:hypothetical protein
MAQVGVATVVIIGTTVCGRRLVSRLVPRCGKYVRWNRQLAWSAADGDSHATVSQRALVVRGQGQALGEGE